MKLSVKIMAHEKRAQFIPGLVEQLGITDDDVIWDQKNNRWDTGRRAWEAIDQTADWGCVIQDDALVCRNFIPAMEKALARLSEIEPKCVVSPYVGTRRPMAHRVEAAVQDATHDGASWIKMPSLNWGVAITLPTWMIDAMLPWCDKQQYPNYDRRIGRYAIDRLSMPTMCTWPSLVDHRDTPSLVQHGNGRSAHRFIGEDRSALDIDWSGPVTHMGGPRLSAYRRVMGPVPERQRKPYDTTSVSGRIQARSLRVANSNPTKRDEVPVRPSRLEDDSSSSV